jgi:hypothetical protein
MTTTLSTNSKIVTDNDRDLETVATPIPKTPKPRLVARWLIDENSNKPYCQWVIED